MIRNFKNFVVKEEQEYIYQYGDIELSKGFQKIKKICNDYGYTILHGYSFNNNLIIQFEYNHHEPHIIYDNTNKKFEINIESMDFLPIQDFKIFCNKCNNALKLVEKLSKMDLMKILPIKIEK